MKTLLLLAIALTANASIAEDAADLGLEAKNGEIRLKGYIKQDLLKYVDRHPYLIKPIKQDYKVLKFDDQAKRINKLINKERAK